MRWLARFLFLAFCLCLISCSAQSFLFLHNDTSQSFDFKVSAIFSYDKKIRTEQGTVEAHHVVPALSYFADEAENVGLEIVQNGKKRTQTFPKGELPDSLTYASSGGTQSYIKVSDQDITIGNGSGNLGSDFQHRFGIFFPCFGLILFGGVATIVVSIFKTKRRQKQEMPA